MSAAERFEANYVPVPESGCWLWTATLADGYGQFQVDGVRVLAHRYALEQRLGRPLAEGMQGCHTCDVTQCVNPAHLFEGTHQDNVDDKVNKGRQSKGAAHGARLKNPCCGERHRLAKLTVADVVFIRASTLSDDELGRMFGMAPHNIKKARDRITWKSVH